MPFPLVRALVLGVLTAIRFSQPTQCRVLYYVVGAIMLAVGVALAFLTPHRLPIDDCLTVVQSVLIAVLAFSVATAQTQFWAAGMYAVILWIAVAQLLLWLFFSFVDDFLEKQEAHLAAEEAERLSKERELLYLRSVVQGAGKGASDAVDGDGVRPVAGDDGDVAGWRNMTVAFADGSIGTFASPVEPLAADPLKASFNQSLPLNRTLPHGRRESRPSPAEAPTVGEAEPPANPPEPPNFVEVEL